MKISVRFTAAVHTILCIEFFGNKYRVTSDFISGSTGVNAVIIRKILLQLQKAGLVETAAGVGGSHLAKKPDQITLLDVYNAINEGEEEREIFNFHPTPNSECPVGQRIHLVLDPTLDAAQNALEAELDKTTIADLLERLDSV